MSLARKENKPQAGCFTLFSRYKTDFDFPLHYHEEFELNFIQNGKGAKRVIGDGREKDSELMLQRDETNRKFYKELHSIDWFDLDEINKKHSFVFDNSNMEIADEIKKIGKEIISHKLADKMLVQKMIDNADLEEKDYWSKGKEHYSKLLEEKNLLFEAEFVLKEINRLFRSEVQTLPTQLKDIILKYK